MTFYAFESASEEGYMLCVSKNEKIITDSLSIHKVLRIMGLESPPDTAAVGTVQAENQEEAVAKIQAGDWEYSQKC